jgi:signal transduction histidine kinase
MNTDPNSNPFYYSRNKLTASIGVIFLWAFTFRWAFLEVGPALAYGSYFPISILAGYLLGWRAGMAVGLIYVPLGFVLTQKLGRNLSIGQVFLNNLVSGVLFSVVGVLTGLIRALLLQSREDLRQRKELESELLNSQKLRTIGELASGIAHEVNNPLAIIYSKTEILLMQVEKGTIDPSVLRRELEKIQKTAERISRLIKGLKALSRKGDNDPFELVDANELIEDCIALIAEQAKNQQIKVSTAVPTKYAFECRAVQIHQIIANLLSNSVFAVRDLDEKWIHLEVQGVEGLTRIIFSDSGKGIPKETAAKIMQPFFTTKPNGQGTGLGLSISRGIAWAHGGDLRLDTDCPNTRFILEIPTLAKYSPATIPEAHQTKE